MLFRSKDKISYCTGPEKKTRTFSMMLRARGCVSEKEPETRERSDSLRSVRALEDERLAAEKDVVESPSLGSKNGRNSHLAALDEEGKVDGAGARVSSGPTLARSSVGRVAVGPEALSINKDLGDDVDGLVAREAEELGDDGGGGELDEDDVVESDAVERVLERHAALDLVRHDHRAEDVLDGEGSLASGDVGARDPVGDGHDGSAAETRRVRRDGDARASQ